VIRKKKLEKRQLEELKEERKERCLEHQAMMMMFMAMHGGDVSEKIIVKATKKLVYKILYIF
jgi:hypothetical protein